MFKKVLVNLLATVVLMGMITNPVLAAKTAPPPEEDTNDTIGIQSLQYINDMDTTISDNGDGTVDLFGETTTKTTVDKVTVKLYLQQWNGSTWVDIEASDTFSAYNYFYVNGSDRASVEPGYYYRTKGVHSASNDGTTEQKESFSSYKLIE